MEVSKQQVACIIYDLHVIEDIFELISMFDSFRQSLAFLLFIFSQNIRLERLGLKLAFVFGFGGYSLVIEAFPELSQGLLAPNFLPLTLSEVSLI